MTDLEELMLLIVGVVAVWLAIRPVIKKGGELREKEHAQVLIKNAEAIQAASDDSIITAYANMLESGSPGPSYQDIVALPHPKDAILSAIERQIVREPNPPRVGVLKAAAIYLAYYQAGVGPKGIPFGGFDIGAINAATSDPKQMARMIAQSPHIAEAERLRALANKDENRIMERMDPAEMLRNARLRRCDVRRIAGGVAALPRACGNGLRPGISFS